MCACEPNEKLRAEPQKASTLLTSSIHLLFQFWNSTHNSLQHLPICDLTTPIGNTCVALQPYASLKTIHERDQGVKSIKVDDQSGQTLFVTESLNLHAYLYIHAHLYDEKMSRWRGLIQGITLLGQISRFFIQ